MIGYFLEVAQAVLALALAPLLVGFIRLVKARLQNRRGAPAWQPYFELRKLFGKEVVMSNNASWLFRFAPYIVFASAVAVTFLVPLITVPLPFDGVGDLLVVVYILLLGTFFFATTTGVLSWSDQGSLWPIYPLIVGVAFFAAYFASGREQAGYLVPGAILSLVGLVFLGITLTGASYDYIGKIWPIFLIIAGVILLVGPRLRWTERHN